MLEKGAQAEPGDALTPEEAIKDPFVLEFLDLKDEYSESQLEDALIHRLEDFLLELGGDFAFVGRQRRLRIGASWFRVDLLSAPKSASTLLFLAQRRLPDAHAVKLRALPAGFARLPPRAGGLAIDYVRDGWFKPAALKPVPPDAPGADNDLKDKLEAAVVSALKLAGTAIYAFGERWRPEPDAKDRYFRFLPGSGVHDIHMNQGSGGKHRQDNGVRQDGALVFEYPEGKWLAFFFAFQSQAFETDDKGDPRAG